MKERILLCKPKMCGRELDFIRAALAEDWAVPLGPDVTAFEKELEDFVNPTPTLPAGEGGNLADEMSSPLLAEEIKGRPAHAERVESPLLAEEIKGRSAHAERVEFPLLAEEIKWRPAHAERVESPLLAEEIKWRSAHAERVEFPLLAEGVKGRSAHAERVESPLLAEGVRGRSVVALSSGTAAVHLALIACGVGPGDEVIVQSFTFCASSHPITYLGATPVFVDSERDSWNMDPELLEEAIENRRSITGKLPKAIIPVALYGMPYQIDRIMEIANRYEIPVIEDAAEGLGSRYNGQVLGTFGKYGVLSFNGNKMITTSGGGALVCDNAEDKNKVMWYATQARESYPYYQHEAIGYNYRMSNICAGIGRGQMTVINDHIAHHKHVQALYEELLKDVPGVTMHTNPTPPQPSPQGEGAGLRRDIPVSGNYPLLKENAKRMRENPTKAEKVMWAMLRNDSLGVKFRRQHIIGDYIVDFVDLASGLVIEIDGGYHNSEEQQKLDQDRSTFLENNGFSVLRFTNEEVLQNTGKVLERIHYKLLITLPCGEGWGEADSNFWLCTATLDPDLRIKGQENAYKTIITGAVGGAAGVIHAASIATTDCQPNDNVEALRVCLDKANIEARPLWKPMHKQPVYRNAPAYVNGVSEALFKVGICLPAGPYVTDDDVRYIVDTIKASIG